MNKLVANVLEMTRLEAGTIVLNRDWHVLAEVVGTVLQRFGARLAAHPVSVEIPTDLPLVRVDVTLVEQVLSNLLENAAKYTPAGTRITVSAARHDGELLVAVEDDGPGLPPGDTAQIFAKFHRGNSEGAVGGVGLGLSICDAIVRLHGGRIWAERRPQGGAAFRFTLPVEESPSVPQEAST